MLAVEGERPAGPHPAQDRDGLDQRVHGLLRRTPRASGAGDRIPERSGPQAELDPSLGDQIQARRGLGQHDRRPQRQAGDVRGQPDRPGAAADGRQQGPGVQEAPLVGMVLDRHQVQAEGLGQLGELEHLGGPLGGGGDEQAELDRVTVVHVTRG